MSSSEKAGRAAQRYDTYSSVVDVAWIDEWQASLESNRNTKTSYLSGLMAYLAFLQGSGILFVDANRPEVEEFKADLTRKQKKPATISLYMAGVRSFYRFCEARHGVDDAAGKVKGAKTDRNHKKDFLPREMAIELLSSIETDTLAGKRDYALVNLMLRAGLRDVEVSRAIVADIDFAANDTATLAVQGKGRTSKDQFVVLEEAALAPIRDYLLARGTMADSDPLFSSLSDRNLGKPLTSGSVSRIVKNRLRAIGVDDAKYTAHSLRHTAVTYSLLGGATVQEAQAMARHADITTTMIYAHNVERLRNPAEAKVSNYLDFGQ